MKAGANAAWQRRARPLLGTLLEIGLRAEGVDLNPAFDAAFAAVEEVSRCLSRFDPGSDITRFHALRRGGSLRMRAPTEVVLGAAAELRAASAGAFDISGGTAPQGWRCEGEVLLKLDPGVRLDLGGIGKGHAVDRAVQALQERHPAASGWVNAGGDLRAFGDVDLPLQLRDEGRGGVRPFALLRDGAFATSRSGPGARTQIVGGPGRRLAAAHLSVAAPQCLWADALTKVVALTGDLAHPLLARYGASAWRH